MKNKKLTQYQLMKSAIDKDSEIKLSEKEIKKINSFLFLKLISNDPVYIHIANTLNFFNSIDIVNQYKFIKNSSISKIKFINFSKSKEEKEKKEKINELMKKYKCNEDTAEQYYEILKKSE